MTFWTDDDWKDALSTGSVVHPFADGNLDEGKYKLCIGPEVYVSTQERHNTIRHLKQGEAFIIKPGEFCFILTEERVDIPFDCLGFISMSTKIKFYGLVNVSGFHVDPGYYGRLVFAVFNSGPKTVHLKQGQPIFSLWLGRLTGPNTDKRKIGYNNIDPEIINRLDGNFLTAYQLSEKIDELSRAIGISNDRLSKVEQNWRKLWIYAAFALFVFGILLRGPLFEGVKSIIQYISEETTPGYRDSAPTPPSSQP